MDVSVVLPVYNEEKWIGTCLESLLSQTKKPSDIFVLDDGSTDKTVEIAKSYKGVTVIENQHLHRPAQVKMSLKLPLKEITHLAEADAFYDKMFLEKACVPIEEGMADLCHGRIFTRNLEKMLPRIVESYRRRRWSTKKKETQTGWVFRTSALRKIRIPTDIYVAEDQVIGAEIRALGYRTRYVPEAKFYHYEKESLRELISQQLKWGVGSVPLLSRYGRMLHQKNIRDRWIYLSACYLSVAFAVLTIICWRFLLLLSVVGVAAALTIRGLHLASQGEDYLAGFLFIFYRVMCIWLGFIGFNKGLMLKAAGQDLLKYT